MKLSQVQAHTRGTGPPFYILNKVIMDERKGEVDDRVDKSPSVVQREDELSIHVEGTHRIDVVRLLEGVELPSPFTVRINGPTFECTSIWERNWKQKLDIEITLNCRKQLAFFLRRNSIYFCIRSVWFCVADTGIGVFIGVRLYFGRSMYLQYRRKLLQRYLQQPMDAGRSRHYYPQ